MDIRFKENIVKFDDYKDIMVSSILLREGRMTPIVSVSLRVLNEVEKMEIEESIFSKFERPLNKVLTNADLWVRWEDDSLLKIDLKPHKDIESGSVIGIDRIVFW